MSHGPYYDADEALSQEIAAALYRRRRINANSRLLSATAGAEWRDTVNPNLFIGHFEIKERTRRAQMRESAYFCLIDHLRKLPGLTSEIERDLEGHPIGLMVRVVPVQIEENNFDSLAALQAANIRELAKASYLDKPIF